jgi:hypothetical protein
MELREFLTQILAIVFDRLLVDPAPPNRVELHLNKRRPKIFPLVVPRRHERRERLMQQAIGDDLNATWVRTTKVHHGSSGAR